MEERSKVTYSIFLFQKIFLTKGNCNNQSKNCFFFFFINLRDKTLNCIQQNKQQSNDIVLGVIYKESKAAWVCHRYDLPYSVWPY